MAGFGSSGGGFGKTSSGDLNDLATLEELIKNANVPPPKKNIAISALKKLGGILGATNSAVAGAVSATMKGQNPLTESTRRFGDSLVNGNQYSFSDVIKETYTPKTFKNKAAVETLGFTADILFDPLTYLTLGVGKGVQVGTKVLNKAGQKTLLETTGKLVKSGMDYDTAHTLVREVFTTVADKGIDDVARVSLRNKGITDEVINDIVSKGTKVFDEGGVKMFGKSLVKGETIAQSRLGKGAKAVVAKPAVQERIQALKTLFSFGGKVDPRIAKFLEEGAAKTAFQNSKFFNKLIGVFDNVSEKQLDEFWTKVNSIKQSLITRTNEKVAQKSLVSDTQLRAITGKGVVRKNGELTNRAKKVLEEQARKEVKKEMASEKLVFADPRLQKLADDMFEGNNSIVKEMADMAGLPEDMRIKFYIPTRFEEFQKIAKTSGGNLSSAKSPFLKKFTGVQREDAIKNPLELYSQAALEINAARIKTETLEKISKELGASEKQIKEMAQTLLGESLEKATKEQIASVANKLGYEVFTRKRLLDVAQSTTRQTAFQTYKSVVDQSKNIISELRKNKPLAKQLGKKLDTLEKASKDLFDETLSEQMARIEKGVGDFTDKQKLDLEEKFINLETKLSETGIKNEQITKLLDDNKQILDSIKGEKTLAKETLKETSNEVSFFIPKEIAETVKELYNPKESPIDTIAKLTGFDYSTRLFKGWVTSLFPAFHFRNYTSNQFQNMINMGVNALNPVLHKQAMDMTTYLQFQNPRIQKLFPMAKKIADEIGNKTITTKYGMNIKMKDMIEKISNKTNFLDSGQFGDFEQMIKEGTEFITGGKNLKMLNPLSSEFAGLKAGRFVGTGFENQSKLVHILGKLKDGHTLDEAIKSAEEVLFNYSKLSPFEKQVMRRVIPFYTFMSRNLALQARTLAKQPGFIANELKTFRAASNLGGGLTEEEEQNLPDYLLSSLGIRFGSNKEGNPQILSGFGLPIEEMLQRFSGEKGFVWNAMKNTMVQSNPLIKYPIERVTGVDLFRGKPIAEIRKADGLKSMFDSMPPKASEQLKSLIGYNEQEVDVYDSKGKKTGKETRAFADPIALHLMRNLPTARLQSTSDFLRSQEQTTDAKTLRLLTGAKMYSVDIEREKFFNELERKQELQKFLMEVLGYKEFSTIYDPNKKSNKKKGF
jgi:hypothetical protein